MLCASAAVSIACTVEIVITINECLETTSQFRLEHIRLTVHIVRTCHVTEESLWNHDSSCNHVTRHDGLVAVPVHTKTRHATCTVHTCTSANQLYNRCAIDPCSRTPSSQTRKAPPFTWNTSPVAKGELMKPMVTRATSSISPTLPAGSLAAMDSLRAF